MRQFLRGRRKALTPAQQQQAAVRLAQYLAQQHFFRRARTLAFYIANDGELDPHLLYYRALALGKDCFLPVLDKRSPKMDFALYRRGDKLIRNQFGIAEPAPKAPRIAADELDLVCLPLVGFDEQGNRLGMGGGFYDRTFAYRRQFVGTGPLLVGLAHQCQQVTALPAQPWDVPLDVIATDVGLCP